MLRWYLLLNAAMFLGFGLTLLANPKQLTAWVGLAMPDAQAKTEIRAFYGGLEIALAIFLIICVLIPGWAQPALAMLLLSYMGILLGRVTGFLVDGLPQPGLIKVAFVEACLLGVGIWLWLSTFGKVAAIAS